MDIIESEYKSVQFGDKRLDKRAKLLFKRFCDTPMESIPGSCKSWAETKAAYRFFDNDLVTAEKVIEPHRMATLQRISAQPVVLLIQDTTILNFSGHTDREDIGPIQQDNVRGILLHPMLAVSPQRDCLGVVDYEQWARRQLKNQTPKERKEANRKTPLEEKESHRWLRGYEKANEIAKEIPTTKFIYIADREGDLYDIYQEAQNEFGHGRADFIIRGNFDRSILDSDGERTKLKAALKSSPSIGKISFIINSSTRKKRVVTQNIFAKEVHLRAPENKGNGFVKTTVVVAVEEETPAGEKPLEWILLTSLPVANLEAASKIIDCYLCRWQIEIFFKILKSGCNIEKIQLTNKKRFDPCLAMYLIVAWRILFFTHVGRVHPSVDAECFFEPIEWQTAYVMIHRKPPPKMAPSLEKMIKMVAQLGGFLGRKSDNEPGSKTMWKGLQNLHQYIKARETFQIAFAHTYG